MTAQTPDQPSYLRRMLTSQSNLYAGLTTAIASSLLSIPYGAAGAVLPLVAFIAGEAIAALFVPSSPAFRAKVDREHAARLRGEREASLIADLRERVQSNDKRWETHARLVDRAEKSHELRIPAGNTSITTRDIDRLLDAPNEYLSLWLAALDMRQRRKAIDIDELSNRIRMLDKQIIEGRGDLPSLKRAHTELSLLHARHERLGSRLEAIEAATLSLPDAVEEIHLALGPTHAVTAGESRLSEAVQRLREQEEIERTLADELKGLALATPAPGALPAAARSRLAAAQSTGRSTR